MLYETVYFLPYWSSLGYHKYDRDDDCNTWKNKHSNKNDVELWSCLVMFVGFLIHVLLINLCTSRLNWGMVERKEGGVSEKMRQWGSQEVNVRHTGIEQYDYSYTLKYFCTNSIDSPVVVNTLSFSSVNEACIYNNSGDSGGSCKITCNMTLMLSCS